MRAGLLRSRVTIQQQTRADDAYGGATVTWSTFATRWAHLRPLRGSELIAAQQINSHVQGEALIRFTTGVDATMRIVYGTRVLQILAVVNMDERDEQQRLLYRETAGEETA